MDKQTIEALISALNSNKEIVRREAAAEALGQVEQPAPNEVVTALAAALEDPDDRVAGCAAHGFRRIASDGAQAIPALVAALMREGVSQRAYNALAMMGPAAVQALLPILRHKDRKTAKNAISLLHHCWRGDPEAIPALIAALSDDDGDPFTSIADRAAQTLSQVGSTEVVSALLTALKAPDVRLRRGAARAFSLMNNKTTEVIAALVSALHAEDRWVRIHGMSGLMNLEPFPAQYVSEVLGALYDPEGSVRAGAAEILSKLNEKAPNIVSALIGALQDREWHVRLYAAKGLEKFQDDQRSMNYKDLSPGTYRFLVRATREAVPALLECLSRSVDQELLAPASALKALGASRQCIPLLIKMFRQSGNWVANALSTFGKEAIAPLIAALANQDPAVRRGAAYALHSQTSLQPGGEAIPALLKLVQDPEATVRNEAARALGSIKSADAKMAVSALVGLLRDDDGKVRSSAMHALSKFGPAAKTAIAPLIEALEEKDGDLAASALATVGAETIPELITALRDKRVRVRIGAADALGYLRHFGQPATFALINALEDQDRHVRLHAAAALRFAGPEAIEAVPSRWQDFVSTAFVDRGGS